MSDTNVFNWRHHNLQKLPAPIHLICKKWQQLYHKEAASSDRTHKHHQTAKCSNSRFIRSVKLMTILNPLAKHNDVEQQHSDKCWIRYQRQPAGMDTLQVYWKWRLHLSKAPDLSRFASVGSFSPERTGQREINQAPIRLTVVLDLQYQRPAVGFWKK